MIAVIQLSATHSHTITDAQNHSSSLLETQRHLITRPAFRSFRPSFASCKSSTSDTGLRNRDFKRLRSGPYMWERKRGRFHRYAASECPCFFARDSCQLHFRIFAHESRDGLWVLRWRGTLSSKRAVRAHVCLWVDRSCVGVVVCGESMVPSMFVLGMHGPSSYT